MKNKYIIKEDLAHLYGLKGQTTLIETDECYKPELCEYPKLDKAFVEQRNGKDFEKLIVVDDKTEKLADLLCKLNHGDNITSEDVNYAWKNSYREMALEFLETYDIQEKKEKKGK